VSTYDKRRPWEEVTPFVDLAVEVLRRTPSGGDLFSPPPPEPVLLVAGSYRRQCPDVGDLDVIVVTDEPLTTWNWVGLKVTEKKAFGWLDIGGERMMLDAWRCPPDSVGPFLLFLTGPPDLNVWMRQRADRRGLLLNQYGLFVAEKNDRGKTVPGDRVDERVEFTARSSTEAVEQKVLDQLELDWLPPQERDHWRTKWLRPNG